MRRAPHIDIVRAQDVGLSGVHDRVILDWAAKGVRIVLTHDVSTMKKYAYERMTAGLAMAGVFAGSQSLRIADAIESITLVAECSVDGEWSGQVRHLPLWEHYLEMVTTCSLIQCSGSPFFNWNVGQVVTRFRNQYAAEPLQNGRQARYPI